MENGREISAESWSTSVDSYLQKQNLGHWINDDETQRSQRLQSLDVGTVNQNARIYGEWARMTTGLRRLARDMPWQEASRGPQMSADGKHEDPYLVASKIIMVLKVLELYRQGFHQPESMVSDLFPRASTGD